MDDITNTKVKVINGMAEIPIRDDRHICRQPATFVFVESINSDIEDVHVGICPDLTVPVIYPDVLKIVKIWR